MDATVKPGYKESEFGRGVAIDVAGVMIAFQSDDWRVQCTALLVVGAINVSYNFGRWKQKEAVITSANKEISP